MSTPLLTTPWIPGEDRLHPHFVQNRASGNQVFGVEHLTGDPNDLIRLRSMLEQKRTWTMPLRPAGLAVAQIEGFVADCVWHRRQYGGHVSCIGYPMMHMQHRGEYFFAPLMLWQVDVHRDAQQQWRLTRTRRHDQYLNPFVVQWLVNFYPAIDQALFEKFDEKSTTRESLERLIFEIAHRAETSYLSSVEGLYQQNYPLPFFENLLIVQAATLGLYPATLWKSILQMPAQVLESSPWKATLPHVLDPDQTLAFRDVMAGNAAVSGQPGSGKTYLARRLMLEALAQGKRVLVVSPYPSVLDSYMQFMDAQDLGRLAALLADAQNQMPEMMLRLAQEVKTKPQGIAHHAAAFQLAINQLERSTLKLDDTEESLRLKGLLGQTWSATVHRFLEAQEQESKEVLNNLLLPQDFEFTDSSWAAYRAQLERIEPLLEALGTLNHPLALLHDRWFGADTEVATSRSTSRQILDQTIDALTDLHRGYLKHLDDYSNMLSGTQDSKLRMLRSRVNSVMALFADYESLYSQQFINHGQELALLKPLMEAFQSKKSDVAQAAKEVAEQYKQLKTLYQRHRIFDFAWLRDRDVEVMAKVKENLTQFEASLQLWRRKADVQVQEDIHRLNSKLTTGQLLFDKKTKALETQLDRLLGQLNSQQLLSETLSHRMLTLHTRRTYIEDLLAKLLLIRSGYSDYNDYFPFRQLMQTGGVAIQKLVTALARVRSSNWLQAFESWFLYHFLAQNYDMRLADDDFLLYDSNKRLGRIVEQVPGHIWAQQAAQRQLGAGSWPHTHHKPTEQSWLHTASELVRSDGKSFQAFYPLWLSTPRSLFNMLSTSGACTWDLVIVEQAEDVSAADLKHLCHLGTHHLLTYAHNTPGAHLPVGTHALRYDHLLQPQAVAAIRRQGQNPSIGILPCGYDRADAVALMPVAGDSAQSVVQKLIDEVAQKDHVQPTLLLFDTKEQYRHTVLWLQQVENDISHPDRAAVIRLQKAGLVINQLGAKGLSSTDRVVVLFTDAGKNNHNELIAAAALSVRKLVIAYPAYWSDSIPTALSDVFKTIMEVDKTGSQLPAVAQTTESTGLERHLTRSLRGLVRPERLIQASVIAHTYYPLIIKPAHAGQPYQIVVVDDEIGREPASSHLWHFHRMALFEQAGWHVIRTWSANWWRNASVEGRRIAGLILENDRKYSPKPTLSSEPKATLTVLPEETE
jgi:hypothetical protein